MYINNDLQHRHAWYDCILLWVDITRWRHSYLTSTAISNQRPLIPRAWWPSWMTPKLESPLWIPDVLERLVIRTFDTYPNGFLLTRTFPASFSFKFLQFMVRNVLWKNWRWLELNRRPPVSEATAHPTELQLLSKRPILFQIFNFRASSCLISPFQCI